MQNPLRRFKKGYPKYIAIWPYRIFRWTGAPPPLTEVTRWVSLGLAFAAIANVFLVSVAYEDTWFQWAISIAAGFSAGGLIDRAFSVELQRRHTWACLLSATMWTSNVIEVVTAPSVSDMSKLRQGVIYSTFAFLSSVIYLVERLILITKTRGEGDDT